MTAVSTSEVVVWPDLSRFGAELTVVWNPSAERRFLRFAIYDRRLFEQTSGLQAHSLNARMRDAGFAYSANETVVNAERAYDNALLKGGGVKQAEQAAAGARTSLYFYSNAMRIRHARLQVVVPSLALADYRSLPTEQLRSTDTLFLTDTSSTAFIRGQQSLMGAQLGVWYSTPADRVLAQTMAGCPYNLHQILEYRDLPPVSEHSRKELSDAFAALRAFHPAQLMERAVRQQTLGLDGMPLRAPCASAAIIGYATRDAAIAANDGNPAGIEQCRFDHSVPIGFDPEGGRLMILKDARYLEYRGAQLPEEEERYNVQRHLDFMAGVKAVRDRYEMLDRENLLEADAWSDRETIGRARDACDEIFAIMRATLAPVAPTRGFMEARDLAFYGSQRESSVIDPQSLPFLRFLRIFQTQLYNVVQQRWIELEALSTYSADVTRLFRHTSTPAVVALSEESTQGHPGAISRENVWPEPDVLALRENGVTPEIAFIVRELHRQLPEAPCPEATEHRPPSQSADFVRAVAFVRECFEGIQTRDDLEEACGRLRVHVREEWFHDGAGQHFVAAFQLWDAAKSSGHANPLSALFEVALASTAGSWNWALAGRTNAGKQVAARVRAEQRVTRPTMQLERRGVDHRVGIDVDDEMLIEVFGVRQVEYGIWLPQRERREALNQTFDALMDLAGAMALPPRTIGLGGTLTLAFGARGTGAQAATEALYETGTSTLHLTRQSGGGKLAREWARAFERWLVKATMVAGDFSAVELATRTGSDQVVVPAIVRDFMEVATRTRVVSMSRAEVIRAWSTTQINGELVPLQQRLALCIDDWINRMDALLPQDEQQAEFHRYATARLSAEWTITQGLEAYGMVHLRDVAHFVSDVACRMDEEAGSVLWRQHVEAALPIRLAQVHETSLKNLRHVLTSYSPEQYRRNSMMFADALWYDARRRVPHWSTDTQLFVRTFEAWVQQRIENITGNRSQYLVFGCESELGALRSVYPRGADREDLFTMLETFFSKYAVELAQLAEDHPAHRRHPTRLRSMDATLPFDHS
jgi:hypothetical protein